MTVADDRGYLDGRDLAGFRIDFVLLHTDHVEVCLSVRTVVWPDAVEPVFLPDERLEVRRGGRRRKDLGPGVVGNLAPGRFAQTRNRPTGLIHAQECQCGLAGSPTV